MVDVVHLFSIGYLENFLLYLAFLREWESIIIELRSLKKSV